MSRTFFGSELEGVAIYWRIQRRDGVALGFTTHDRDLRFNGVRYSSAPGMIPSAVKLSAGLELDSAEVRGALSHDSICADDLESGRYDRARVEVGLVDWETLERTALYSGTIGSISFDGVSFESELRSAKAELEHDLVPRTSPTCRASFCGLGCGLSAERFTHEVVLESFDPDLSKVLFATSLSPAQLMNGRIRWIDGPHAGITMQILEASNEGLLLDTNLSPELSPGNLCFLREGCDHTFDTCAGRFTNAVNFRGEPFLPGNDMLLRYPTSSN